MRNERTMIRFGWHAFAGTGFWLAATTFAVAQLSMPIGQIYTSHGVYTWAGASPNPLFNIPGNGWMTSPGANYPIVQAHTEISGAIFGGIGPWIDWITPAQPAFPTFGGARSTLRGFSTGASAGLQWSNYLLGDRTPPNLQAGSYNLSGGDITGMVGPLGWTGRAGIMFPFQLRITKGWGYAALGAAFELEIYNAANQLVSMFDLGVIMATDGVGPRRDGLAWWYINIFNGPPPGALTLGGVFNQNVIPGVLYTANGWVAILTPQLNLGPGWRWVINGRLTLLLDPESGDMSIDYSQLNDPNILHPDLGYNVVPEPFSLAALSTGLLGLLLWRRKGA